MRSEKSDTRTGGRRQSEKAYSGERLRALLTVRGKDLSWLKSQTEIAVSTLSDYQRDKRPRVDAALKIARALGVSVEELFSDNDGTIGPYVESERLNFSAFPTMSDIVSVQALNIEASAGDGSLAIGERLEPGPFHFAGDWLRAKFGSIAHLRLVRIRGTSQEPDLHDGDWVLIDESLNAVENGLAVLVLDDCLMIKRLQREGRILRLVSRNDQYPSIEIDLQRDEGRLRVIGRAVFVFKSV